MRRNYEYWACGAVAIALGLGLSYESVAVPPTALAAAHRSGQTFLTWTERSDLAGESYQVYRHSAPITAENRAQARLLYTVPEGSGLFYANRYPDNAVWRVRYVTRFVISDRGPQLAAGTGLLVWTLATNEFAGAATGAYYYAVTTVDRTGSESTNGFGPGNSIGPVAEGVADPLPVEVAVDAGPRGHVYIQYMDLHSWNPTFLAPHSRNGFYGLSETAFTVTNAIQYAVDYAVYEPECATNSAAAVMNLHGWGGNAYGPMTSDPDAWGWCAYKIYPVDMNETWFFGFARNYDYRKGGEPAAGDIIVNYTEQRLLRMVYDLIRNPPGPPVDARRLFVYGHSMGGSGTLALAQRYPHVFAAACASQPMTDYGSSGDGGGIDWRSDVEWKWGSRAQNLPISNGGPGNWAAPLQAYNGVGVWTWQNHRSNLVARMGDDAVPFGIGHGRNDTAIEWATQGRPVYDALQSSRQCWGGLVTDQDHTWMGFEILPRSLDPVPYQPFGDFKMIRNETVPGLSRCSADPAVPPMGDGAFNHSIEWSASWNNWDGPPVDSSTAWQISLRSLAGSNVTVNVTPRRLQVFPRSPGLQGTWQNIVVGNDQVVASGTFTADAKGLITISNFLVSPSGNRLRLARADSLWSGAADLGSGWKWLAWFGFFADNGSGWIYHNEHGWMYPSAATTANLWLWSASLGWTWTSDTVYPGIFRINDGAWLWYQKGTASPRWFYNLTLGVWEQQ